MITKAQIKVIRSLELKKFRKQYGLFVAEGHKIISDLRQYYELVDLFEGEDARKASLLDTPADLVATFRIPEGEEVSQSYGTDLGNLSLALDSVQNPGNMGTIIRLADWFGIEDIYLSEGCADVYSPKVVQATMGSLARVRIHNCRLASLISSLPDGFPVYGTFLDGKDIYKEPLTPHGLIVMGNEGHGVSDEVAALVTRRLFIPNYPAGRPTGESLNVAIATAVVCSEFRRR